MRLGFVGDSRTVICNGNIDVTSFSFPPNVDFRARRCILDGIIDDVNDNLHNELCVNLRQKVFLTVLYVQVIRRTLPINMTQSLRNHLVNQLRRYMQVHPPLFQPTDRQQIFHQVNEPHGIIIDIGVHLFLGPCVKQVSIGEQIAGITRNRGKRRTQIMRNRSEQICTKLFIFSQNRSRFFFL